MRAKEIYFGLLKRWKSECADAPWLESLKKQYNIGANEWTADRFFLITISWGPWRPERQMDVWILMKNKCPKVLEDLREARENFKGFPLPWQNSRIIAVSRYLRNNSKAFEDVISELRLLPGLEAINYLADVCEVRQNKKTISCFIRDFLLKDTFPIDTRVAEMLSCLELPRTEEEVVELCKKEGISSRVLDRMFYSQWDECPGNLKEKYKCERCGIERYCRGSFLKK